MAEYKIIAVSRHGAILETVIIESATDEEARSRAQQMARYNEAELWQGDRMVAHVPASPPGTRPDE